MSEVKHTAAAAHRYRCARRPPNPPRVSPFQGNETYATLVWRRFRRSTMGMIGLVLVVALIVMAIFGDFFAPMDPKRTEIGFAPPDVIEFEAPDGGFSLMPVRLSDR